VKTGDSAKRYTLKGQTKHRDETTRPLGQDRLAFCSKTLPSLKIAFLCFIEPPQDQHGTNTTIDMAKLTKRDIVVAISNQTGMVQHQVFDVVQRTLDKITDSLANNIPVELRNFGVFQPRLTKPRVGRNPNQPGSSFVIPPRATVKFKAGKIMRQRVEKLSRELKEAAEHNTKAETGAPNGG
jgi:nucleoid DNA-binding protein